MPKKENLEQVVRYADMLSAMGTELVHPPVPIVNTNIMPNMYQRYCYLYLTIFDTW